MYFFLFYNSVSSVLAIFRRILTSSVVALLLLPRLDHPLVIGGLEFLDKGIVYVCCYNYAHPIANVSLSYILSKSKIIGCVCVYKIHPFSIFSVSPQVTQHIWPIYKWKLLTQTQS